MAPAEDQHTTRPSVSVMEICVLLNDAATYTTPCGMMRRSRFFLNSFLRFAARAPAGSGGGGSRDRPEFRSAGGCSFESPCGDRLPRGLLFRFPGEDG